MESGAARRGMRVLCPIHNPDPTPPPGEAVSSEAGLTEAAASPHPHRGCQGNEVFDTAIARDLAGCAYAAYHCVRGDQTVRLRGLGHNLTSTRRALVCQLSCHGANVSCCERRRGYPLTSLCLGCRVSIRMLPARARRTWIGTTF